jgi:hypothetical protein
MARFMTELILGIRGNTSAINQTLTEVLDFSTATYETSETDLRYLSSQELDFSTATYES